MTATIDWGRLGRLLWVAPLAGLAVALAFSLLILGIARAGEARRAGAGTAIVAYSALAIAAASVFCGVVVYGVEIIVSR